MTLVFSMSLVKYIMLLTFMSFFSTGEEIISGGQRIYVADYIAERVEACGIDPNTISGYIKALSLFLFRTL